MDIIERSERKRGMEGVEGGKRREKPVRRWSIFFLHMAEDIIKINLLSFGGKTFLEYGAC